MVIVLLTVVAQDIFKVPHRIGKGSGSHVWIHNCSKGADAFKQGNKRWAQNDRYVYSHHYVNICN